jgi:hypothetical protein
MNRPIFEISLANSISQFIPGEIVTTGRREANGVFFIPDEPLTGRVSTAQGNTIGVDRLNLLRQFSEHTPNNNWLIGETSGATGRMTKVSAIQAPDTRIGLNANLIADALTANGSISSLTLDSSGFGFLSNQIVTIVSKEDTNKTALGISNTSFGGKGIGYYSKEPGSTSSNKKIQDIIVLFFFWKKINPTAKLHLIGGLVPGIEEYFNFINSSIHRSKKLICLKMLFNCQIVLL